MNMRNIVWLWIIEEAANEEAVPLKNTFNERDAEYYCSLFVCVWY